MNGTTERIIPVRDPNSTADHDQATLIVENLDYRDWESVWVQCRWADGVSLFKFTAVERSVPFYHIQFRPGDKCLVNLGGVTVIKGYIETRQVAYDGERHGVQLEGKSATLVGKSSVNVKDGNFDGLSFEEVAKKVLKDHPEVGYKIVGTLNDTKFAQLSNQPGEAIFDFLERIARPRGIIIGNDSKGNYLFIGDHENPILRDQLIEGVNIKRCNFIWRKDLDFDKIQVTSQAPASDGNAFTKASQMVATANGAGYLGTILITPAEQPVPKAKELQDRADNEALWHLASELTVTAVVAGWFRSGGEIWWPGDNVRVESPMCPLSQIMKIQTVTYTQDEENGTETTLELVPPWALKDSAYANVAPGGGVGSPDPGPPTLGGLGIGLRASRNP
jgi:prophage tail gpP-like protein